MTRAILAGFGAFAIFGFASPLYAQSSCTATNDNNDAQCSISCNAGEAAVCANGVGSSLPTCYCMSNPSYDAQSRVFQGKSTKKAKAKRVQKTKPATG
jgi:hypothetical protein